MNCMWGVNGLVLALLCFKICTARPNPQPGLPLEVEIKTVSPNGDILSRGRGGGGGGIVKTCENLKRDCEDLKHCENVSSRSGGGIVKTCENLKRDCEDLKH